MHGGHARGLKPCPALAAAISELSIAIAFALSTLILLLREGSEWEWMGHVEPFLRYASMWALQRLLLVSFCRDPAIKSREALLHSCSVHVTIIIRYLLRRIHAAQLPGLHAR